MSPDYQAERSVENFCGRIALQARADSDPYQLPVIIYDLWCHQRESNLRLIITNDLLYHLTMAAFVLVFGGQGETRTLTGHPAGS